MSQNDAQSRAAGISFRQLKLFESIGRLKSVRRASEECNLSQPAVTQALAKLEQQVGLQLMERGASGSYLNEAGEIFHARAARFFTQVEEALVELGVPGGASAARTVAKRISRSQIRSLIAIVENGSFPAAAEMLGLSQASLQRAARDLEGNLRRPLYYRTAAGIVVTPGGSEFGRRMKLAAQEIELGLEEIEASRGSRGSQIRIGAMPFGGSVLLASVLDEFVHAYPQADVRIANEKTAEMLERLRAGDVDFVIGLLPETPTPELVSQALARTPYSIVARCGHPLLRKGKVTIEDLRAYEWVVGTPGSSRRACFERLFGSQEMPQASIVTCALPIIRHLLARSERLTLMTSYELMHEDDLAAIAFGPIASVPAIGITLRANWMPTRLHSDFIAMLHAHMAKPNVTPLRRAAG
jgi:DNA-binding transcriptional LysR family regulator